MKAAVDFSAASPRCKLEIFHPFIATHFLVILHRGFRTPDRTEVGEKEGGDEERAEGELHSLFLDLTDNVYNPDGNIGECKKKKKNEKEKLNESWRIIRFAFV